MSWEEARQDRYNPIIIFNVNDNIVGNLWHILYEVDVH